MENKYNFKNLVFEGGGIKGLAYAGALRILEQKEIVQKIEKVAGTSAGAITASLLAVGFSTAEITKILEETNFNNFKDESPFIIPNIIRILKKYGWYKGKEFKKWFETTISKKVDKNITFSQLSGLKKESVNNFKELYIVGANISNRAAKIFSNKTTPKMRISEAVRISMSIPIFFASVRKKEGIFADGGIYYNYPINLFDKNGYNKETLGLRVDSKEEIISAKTNKNSKKNISSFKNYSQAIIESLIDIANKTHLSERDWHRTIYINTGSIKATQFDLSEKQKKRLIENGKKGAVDYLKWFDNPSKDKTPLNK